MQENQAILIKYVCAFANVPAEHETVLKIYIKFSVTFCTLQDKPGS